MTFPVTPGQRYYLAVSGYANGDTPGGFTIAASNTLTNTRLQAETSALVVFPNPSNTGQLTMRLQRSAASGQATLLNTLGQTVLYVSVALGTTNQVLRTTGVAAGIYTLHVTVDKQVLTGKVVLYWNSIPHAFAACYLGCKQGEKAIKVGFSSFENCLQNHRMGEGVVCYS
jgi:hypothetical protein